MSVIGECERCAWDITDDEDYCNDEGILRHERCYDDDPK